jgi:imidazolonepropionase-like amidohydrolase
MNTLALWSWSLLAALSPQAFVVQDATVEVGDGTRLLQASVVVDDGLVVDVLSASASVPSGVRRIDGRGKVLSPGLVAVGSQVGLFDVGMEPDDDDSNADGPAVPGFVAGHGFNPRAVHVAVDREEGVTTVVLAPAGKKLFAGQGVVASLSGRLDDRPDVTRPVAQFGAFDGAVAGAWGGSRGGLVLGLRELLDDVRWYRARPRAYDVGDSRPLKLAPVHLRALAAVVDGGGMPWVIHVDRASDILTVLDIAAAEGIRIVVDSGAEAWLVAEQLRAAAVPVIVRPSSSGQLSFDAFAARDDLVTQLHRAGVRVVVASWATEMGTSRLRQEAGIAVQQGLPRDVAWAAITSTPAALFVDRPGAPVRGVIRKGARADLVLWSGDPLEVLSIAEQVWVGGVYDPTPSRPRQLADRYRKKR